MSDLKITYVIEAHLHEMKLVSGSAEAKLFSAYKWKAERGAAAL